MFCIKCNLVTYIWQYEITGVNTSLEYLNIHNNGIDCWDFYNNQEKIYNCELFDYHGTYLAVAICSNDNDVPGVAPDILPIKFMEPLLLLHMFLELLR